MTTVRLTQQELNIRFCKSVSIVSEINEYKYVKIQIEKSPFYEIRPPTPLDEIRKFILTFFIPVKS